MVYCQKAFLDLQHRPWSSRHLFWHCDSSWPSHGSFWAWDKKISKLHTPVNPLWWYNSSNWVKVLTEMFLMNFYWSALLLPLIREQSSAMLVEYLTHWAVRWCLNFCHCVWIMILKVFCFYVIGESTGIILT